MVPGALVQNRAALAGPFQGATLPVDLPPQLDQPVQLEKWAPQFRLQICETEAIAGLNFRVDNQASRVTLEYVDLSSQPVCASTLLRLTRPSEEIFKKQLDLVSNYSELRADRGSEILAQAAPSQVGFWAPIIGMQPHMHRWTQELVALGLSMTVSVEMRMKHMFAVPRPVSLSPQIQPMIPTPGHGSWPSGHSTECFMVARLLQTLLEAANGTGARYEAQLQRFAARAAVNRTVAGLHYPVDSAVGRLLGTALAEFFIARCTGSDHLHERGFLGPQFQGPGGAPIDFDPRVSMTDNKSGYYEYGSPTHPIPRSNLLAFVWQKACAEWRPLE